MVLTIQSSTKAVVLLLLAIVAFLCAYPTYLIIRNLTNNAYLSAMMFLIFWLVAIAVTYIPVIKTLEGDAEWE